MGVTNLTVLITLNETDGVYARVDYQGKHYFVRMEDIEHIHDDVYSIATYLLDLPISVPSFNG